MAKRTSRPRRKQDVSGIAAEVLEAVRGKPAALTPKGTRTPAARLLARMKRPRNAAKRRHTRAK